jgi:hypothetical protein
MSRELQRRVEMAKEEYLCELLKQLTPEHMEAYKALFSAPVPSKDIEAAIGLLERTIKGSPIYSASEEYLAGDITLKNDGESEATERCCFCRERTNWWTRGVPCCRSCATHAQLCDVPNKATWLRRERIATNDPYWKRRS